MRFVPRYDRPGRDVSATPERAPPTTTIELPVLTAHRTGTVRPGLPLIPALGNLGVTGGLSHAVS